MENNKPSKTPLTDMLFPDRERDGWYKAQGKRVYHYYSGGKMICDFSRIGYEYLGLELEPHMMKVRGVCCSRCKGDVQHAERIRVQNETHAARNRNSHVPWRKYRIRDNCR